MLKSLFLGAALVTAAVAAENPMAALTVADPRSVCVEKQPFSTPMYIVCVKKTAYFVRIDNPNTTYSVMFPYMVAGWCECDNGKLVMEEPAYEGQPQSQQQPSQ